MLDDRVRLCKIEGVDEVSYIIREGKPVDEILSVSQERAYDLIVIASSKISSPLRNIGSTTAL